MVVDLGLNKKSLRLRFFFFKIGKKVTFPLGQGFVFQPLRTQKKNPWSTAGICWCHLLINFIISLDPEQPSQKVGLIWIQTV